MACSPDPSRHRWIRPLSTHGTSIIGPKLKAMMPDPRIPANPLESTSIAGLAGRAIVTRSTVCSRAACLRCVDGLAAGCRLRLAARSTRRISSGHRRQFTAAVGSVRLAPRGRASGVLTAGGPQPDQRRSATVQPASCPNRTVRVAPGRGGVAARHRHRARRGGAIRGRPAAAASCRSRSHHRPASSFSTTIRSLRLFSESRMPMPRVSPSHARLLD